MTTPSTEFEDFLRHLTYDERALSRLTTAVRETTSPESSDWNAALKAAFCGAARVKGMRPLTADERDRFMAIPEPEIIEALNLYRGALGARRPAKGRHLGPHGGTGGAVR